MTFSFWTDSVDSTSVGRELCELRHQPGMPSDFDSLTNDAKCAVIIDAGWGPGAVSHFPRLAAGRDATPSFGGLRREAASRMKTYRNLRTFIRRPASPAQTENIPRGGILRPGRTFAQYIARVAKAAISIGYPLPGSLRRPNRSPADLRIRTSCPSAFRTSRSHRTCCAFRNRFP